MLTVTTRPVVLLAALVLTLVPWASSAAQATDLQRFVAMYRAGNAEAAAAGLLTLSRISESIEQRALAEYHLGLALLRLRPTESVAALRRSISIDPDLRPEVAATGAERKAWDDARAQMAVPTGVRFEPATTIPGTGDSIGVVVDVPDIPGTARPRVRVLLALSPGRDPITVSSGFAGERGAWDGTFGNEVPQDGTFPLIVEVLNESGLPPIRWRRSLHVTTEPLPQPFVLAPRPVFASAVVRVRVRDLERKKRARRSGLVWSLGGTLVAFAASRVVPDAINFSAPNSGPRIAVASVYGAGLAGALYGSTKLLFSARRGYETTVLIPDEAVLRRRRFTQSVWQADSARVASLNGRRDSLRRITVQVRERR